MVAVVVAVYTGGAALAAMGTTVGTASAGALAVAGAVGGAVGSIAGQAVGMAIGAQDSFSWKGVALGAIGGAVTGGLAGTDFGAGTIGNRVIQGAAANAITQGVAVATGLQSSFSWRSVAASAVSAGVAQGLNNAMGYNPGVSGQFEIGKSLVTGIGGSLIGQAVRGGKINAVTLATDAFGNILGDSLAAANGQKAVPAPVSGNERQTIMGYFAEGPGTGYASSQSVTLYDGSAISAAENLRRIDLTRGSAYASNDISDPSRRVVSDAGGSAIDGDDGGYSYERAYRNSEGVYTVEASRSPFDTNAAESAKPWSLAEFLNPSGQAPYNSNWQADLVRSTLANAMAQQADRNVPSVRALDSRDAAQIAQQRALGNYLNGQGNMALGGVAASVSMVASRNLQAASMVTELAAPIDSLIAPRGGSGRATMASGVRRGPPLGGSTGIDIHVPPGQFARSVDLPATSANAADALSRKLGALEKAQLGSARTVDVGDGRVLYYGPEIPARTAGPTRGASLVTEHDPITGRVRQYYESYDRDGNSIRVHPKMIDGLPVDSWHYPPTGRELGR